MKDDIHAPVNKKLEEALGAIDSVAKASGPSRLGGGHPRRHHSQAIFWGEHAGVFPLPQAGLIGGMTVEERQELAALRDKALGGMQSGYEDLEGTGIDSNGAIARVLASLQAKLEFDAQTGRDGEDAACPIAQAAHDALARVVSIALGKAERGSVSPEGAGSSKDALSPHEVLSPLISRFLTTAPYELARTRDMAVFSVVAILTAFALNDEEAECLWMNELLFLEDDWDRLGRNVPGALLLLIGDAFDSVGGCEDDLASLFDSSSGICE